MTHASSRIQVAMLAALCLSCQTAYYGAMEKLGYEKRDILVSRVDSARDAQQEAKEQFADALQQFIAVTNFSGGQLEEQYNNLKGEFEESEERASDVRKRVDDVERVAADLFAEWSAELDDYANPEMRRASKRQLDATRTRCQKLIGVMKRAEKKLDPVLAAFRDRVLFLKHNLNARAVASLRGERAKVESDIGALIADMNRSIAEADAFIKEMSAQQG
jgi:hypothetical protein